jgi:KDO2-lipid IV(A) lauroyltransferase
LDYAVYLVVRVTLCLVQAMRIEAARAGARFCAWLFADVFRVRSAVIAENLAFAFPDRTPAQRAALARRMWEHLFLLAVEAAHAPRKIHRTNWRRYVRLGRVVPMIRLLLGDRPVVVVTGHCGNFELGGFMLGLLGFPTYAVARNLDNPFLDRFIGRFRGATGQHLIPKNGGYPQILAVLANRGVISFLADQYAGPKGCWVEFFGRPASAHKAIALLAMEHDAPMAVCYLRRLQQPMQFEMVLHAIADPRSVGDELRLVKPLTQWYTSQLEQVTRQIPEQYWWLHRRWKDTRPPRRRPQAA